MTASAHSAKRVGHVAHGSLDPVRVFSAHATIRGREELLSGLGVEHLDLRAGRADPRGVPSPSPSSGSPRP
jgi:hypothetical protein